VIRFPRLSDDFDCDTSQLFESLKLDAVKALMEANRNAASATDSLGRTPLHLACMDICASEVNVGNTLLEAWPQACAHQDLENRTPLHYLMARNDDIPIMFLEKLLKAHSDARNIKDIVGETPLQILEARAGEVKNAEAVMEVMKRAE
jgi:ankyrin repeat protein